MVWWNPKTWGKTETTTPSTSSVEQGYEIMTDEGGMSVREQDLRPTDVIIRRSSSGGASQPSGASPPPGTLVYNPATKTSEITSTTPSPKYQSQVLPAPGEKGKEFEKERTGFVGAVVGGYQASNKFLREKVTYPAFGFIEKRTGLDLTTKETQNIFTPSLIGFGSWGIKPKAEKDVVAGIGSGILTDVKEKPAKQVLLFGAGAGVGYVASGVVTGVTAISTTAGTITKGGLSVAGAGLGGFYVYQTGKDVISSKTPAEAGGKIGVGAKDLFLFGKGYGTGAKGFQMTRGYWGTRGRTFLETPQGEYPSAKIKSQKGLFEKNIVPELGKKPGAYHTTPDVFWDKTIKFKAGTSELPGAYGSTYVSTPFSRISGSGATTKINVKAWVKSAYTPTGKPGVAYLQPKGFRNVKVRFSSVKQFEGQKFVKNRGYAFFETPVKKGYADIPGIKGEIEAVFRIKSGDYSLVGKGYYTKIAGVRVPIDSFAYAGGKTPPSVTTGGGTTFNPSNYYAPSSKGFVPFFISSPPPSSAKPSSPPPSSPKYPSSPKPSSPSYPSSPKPSSPSYPSSPKPSSPSYPSSPKPSSPSYPSSPPPSTPSYPSSIPSSSSKLPSSPKYPSSSTPSYPRYTSSYKPPTSIMLPFGFGGLGFPKTRKYKGKRKFKYTPDYQSLVLGVFGKAPKGRETGIRRRPIPKGFTWAFKSPKITRGFKSPQFSLRNTFLKPRRIKRKRRRK